VTRRALVLFAAAVAVLILAGCGSKSPSTTSPVTTSHVPVSPPPTTLTVFRVENGKLAAETVHVPHTTQLASAALGALGLAAPVTIAAGTAQVGLVHATGAEVAEIVYTLTRYPSIQRVDVAGRIGLTRDDLAAYVPPILIESPGAGADVPRSFHVVGTASVFEATFVVELVVGGKVTSKQSVTASEGAPARGTFDVVVQASTAGPARLVAFEASAENGQPLHEVDLPVTVTP